MTFTNVFELSFGPSSWLDVIPGFVRTAGSRFFSSLFFPSLYMKLRLRFSTWVY